MISQQYKQGYNDGYTHGVDYGLSCGEFSALIGIAGKVNMLVRQLCLAVDSEDSSEKWAIIHTLFDVTRPHLIDETKASVPKLPKRKKRKGLI